VDASNVQSTTTVFIVAVRHTNSEPILGEGQGNAELIARSAIVYNDFLLLYPRVPI